MPSKKFDISAEYQNSLVITNYGGGGLLHKPHFVFAAVISCHYFSLAALRAPCRGWECELWAPCLLEEVSSMHCSNIRCQVQILNTEQTLRSPGLMTGNIPHRFRFVFIQLAREPRCKIVKTKRDAAEPRQFRHCCNSSKRRVLMNMLAKKLWQLRDCHQLGWLGSTDGRHWRVVRGNKYK